MTSPVATGRAARPRNEPPTAVVRLVRSLPEWALVGILGIAVGGAFSWVPYGWTDEAATKILVSRPLGELWQTITQNVDAVHGTYYLALKCWVAVFGSSIASLRLTSAIAIGLAAAGCWYLGRQIGGGRLPLLSGLLFATVPMATWAATEARSYSWDIAAAVWLTVCFIRAIKGCRGGWVLYALVACVSTYLFVYLAMVLLSHLTAAALSPSLRRHLLRVGVAAVTAMSAAAPLVVLILRQSQQVAWIAPVDLGTVRGVFSQWFDRSLVYAVPAWALVVVAVVLLKRHQLRVRMDHDAVLWILVMWLIVPTIVLLVVSLVSKPFYVPRYTVVSLPAVAMLMALAVQRLRPVALPVLALMVLVSLPTYVQQRTPMAKGDDWGEIVRYVQGQARTGDAIFFADASAQRAPRQLLAEYGPALAGLRDPAFISSGEARRTIWDQTAPAAVAATRVEGARRVLVVARSHPSGGRDSAVAAFVAVGYSLVNEARFRYDSVSVLTR